MNDNTERRYHGTSRWGNKPDDAAGASRFDASCHYHGGSGARLKIKTLGKPWWEPKKLERDELPVFHTQVQDMVASAMPQPEPQNGVTG